ncbi:hypothetical protein AURDEDRAFT_146014 [Auricularia subglabra TFB-10046 SS5]|nr:hypothetical protein AURDEDRAFT_146014 [Auricularia subglabra TFB-10046 SS5]
MAAVMSDESYEHIVLPSSLGSEPKSKAAWLDRFKTGFASWFNPGDFEAIIHEVFEGPGHVTVQMSSRGTTKSGKAFANEYMAVFQVRQDASGAYKIVRVKEFMDSQTMTNWAKTLAE